MQESERDEFFQEWMFDNEQMFKDKVKEQRREDVAVVCFSAAGHDWYRGVNALLGFSLLGSGILIAHMLVVLASQLEEILEQNPTDFPFQKK